MQAKAFSEDLQCRQPDQEWLEETAHILNKAVLTLQQQADSVKAESERLNEYVESVKQAASDLALRGAVCQILVPC
jgi:methyl-accepting chemotaxis protein